MASNLLSRQLQDSGVMDFYPSQRRNYTRRLSSRVQDQGLKAKRNFLCFKRKQVRLVNHYNIFLRSQKPQIVSITTSKY